MREAGKKQLIIGLVIAGIGLAISLGSYLSAASSSGGGSYFLLWGLVIVGLVRAFRGFSMMKAAGSSPATTTQGANPAAPAPPAMPAMPPQPTVSAPEPLTRETATAASPPPPAAPSSSMWD
jgi:hypothetical protein